MQRRAPVDWEMGNLTPWLCLDCEIFETAERLPVLVPGMNYNHSIIRLKGAVQRFLFAVLVLFSGVGVRAAVPAPLDAALKRVAEQFERWAYTETTVTLDREGRARKGE